jgi:hypothetical protein
MENASRIRSSPGLNDRASLRGMNDLSVEIIVFQLLYQLVQDDFAMIYHNGTPADLLQIAGVMAGQEYGRSLLPVKAENEFPDLLLDNHIQADGMQTRGCKYYPKNTIDLCQIVLYMKRKAFQKVVG